MPNIQNRQIGEGAAHPDATKENATAGNRGADKTNLTDRHSTTRLGQVALAINSEHTLAMRHAESAIEHARRVGQLLIEAKSASVGIADLRRLPIVFSFPWSRAEIAERYPHPGYERNVFAEVMQ